MKVKNNLKMKTKRGLQAAAFAVCLTVGFTACKKDKTDPVPTPEPVETVSLSIEDLKKLSTGSTVTIGEKNKNFKVKGIVISNKDAKNIDAKTVVLQQANDKPGIIVNFSAAHSFAPGDEVQIGVSNQKLEQVNGEIVLNTIPVDSASKTGTGTITPKITTVQELSTNAAAWNGTLVQLGEGRFYGEGKYVKGIEYADASGRIKVGVLDGAAFKDETYMGAVTKLTGIVRLEGTTARIDIRNTNDVIGTGDPIIRTVVEDFSGITYEMSDPNYNSEIITRQTFSTAKDTWTIGSDCYLLNGNRFDGSLLSADKKYFYMIGGVVKNSGENLNNSLSSAYEGIKVNGLKTITVRFAGSKLAGEEILNGIASNAQKISVASFDPATDYFQIGAQFIVRSRPRPATLLQLHSPKLTKTGEWMTATFEIPSKAELINMYPDLTEADIDAFLNNPVPTFYNESTRANSQEYKSDPVHAPIIIDKIEFGYTK